MSAAGTPVCAEAIGDETLAFWRDGFLRDAGMARRLDAHTPGCASCQRRLAAMESFGAAVRRQRIPDPDPLLWRRLEARMVGGSGRASLLFGMNARTFTVGAMLSAIGAVAAVVLIAVSFLTLFSTVRPPGAPSDIFTRQASATATANAFPRLARGQPTGGFRHPAAAAIARRGAQRRPYRLYLPAHTRQRWDAPSGLAHG